MILNESEVIERLESPLNLMNRLRDLSSDKNSKSSRVSIPSLPPKSSEVIDNLDEKLAYGSIKSKAAGIMVSALDELKARLPEVTKAKELSSVAEQMNKIITVQNEKGSDGNFKIGQVIIYAPQVISEDNYDVIDISRNE